MTWGQLAEALSAQPGAAAGVRRVAASRFAGPNNLFPIEAVGDFYGLQGDMLPPTRAEAMSVPAMARARHLIVAPSRLPMVVKPADYRQSALIEQPDPKRTRVAVLADTLDDLLFNGIGLWRVTERYAADNRPRHAERIGLWRLTRDPQTGAFLIDEQRVPDADLIWFEGPHEGILAFGGRALRSAVRLDRSYNATAKTPAVATELHQTTDDEMDDDEVQALVDGAQAAIAARGVVWTNNAVELKTHTASAENLLIQGRNAAAVDIARMSGLPAAIIDAVPPGASDTYQNVQAKLREARDIGLDSYAAAVTARLSLDDVLPRGVWCEFEWDPLLRDGFTARMEGYKAAQDAGVYDVDECRELERGRPLEGEA